MARLVAGKPRLSYGGLGALNNWTLPEFSKVGLCC